MASPKLRFKEFDGGWANLKYKDVLNIKYGKDHKSLSDGEIPVYGTGGIMRYVDKFLYEGESILIGRKGTIDQPKYVNEKFWTVDTLFYTEIKENSVPLFLFQHALQVNWLGLNEATGVPSLNTTSINNVDISLPSKEEQTKIASFLSAVDEKISQLTQKHQLLSQYKQGMMQKLFSQQIRFKADDGSEFGEWEEKPLSHYFSKIRNGFVGVATPFYVDNGIKYLQGKNIKNGKIDDTGLIHISEEFHLKKKNSKLQPNDILMVQSGHVGECVVVTEEYGNANCHALLVLTPSDSHKVNSQFIVYYFYSEFGRKDISLIKTGNTIEHVLASDIKEVCILFPCVEEQTKIANFLSAIDQKIEVVAQQIKQEKQWKKGLLQQMFV